VKGITMMSEFDQAVLGTLEWLKAQGRERARPQAAKNSFHLLRQKYPGTPLELLWEEEVFDGTVHYDVLLQLPRLGSVSLSFCPDRALPWPLRGVHRWSDADLVRVNQNVLKVDRAIACLDFIWRDAGLVDYLVNLCLIDEAIEKNPIEVSDADLQEAMDAFRRAARLYSAAETHDWIGRHGLTHEKLELLVAAQFRVDRLRERISEGRVESYFVSARGGFDTVRIARFDVPDQKSALQVLEQVHRCEVDFYEAAQRHFLGEAHPSSLGMRPLFEILQRRQAPRDLVDAIFAADSGELLGPIAVDNGYALIRVLAFTPACLDDRTRRAIREILFTEWLAERRRAATIEWCWGNAEQTSGTS
jgi:putative peptide maturation system protein